MTHNILRTIIVNHNIGKYLLKKTFKMYYIWKNKKINMLNVPVNIKKQLLLFQKNGLKQNFQKCWNKIYQIKKDLHSKKFNPCPKLLNWKLINDWQIMKETLIILK